MTYSKLPKLNTLCKTTEIIQVPETVSSLVIFVIPSHQTSYMRGTKSKKTKKEKEKTFTRIHRIFLDEITSTKPTKRIRRRTSKSTASTWRSTKRPPWTPQPTLWRIVSGKDLIIPCAWRSPVIIPSVTIPPRYQTTLQSTYLGFIGPCPPPNIG